MNPVDAALARAFSGAQSAQFSIPTFSGILAGTSNTGFVNRGTKLQSFGSYTGLKTGKVVSKIMETVKIKNCIHLPTAAKGAGCAEADALYGNVMYSSQNLSDRGDSGALVLTSDSCPQPVGMIIGGNATYDFINGLGPVLSSLQGAGNYSGLSIVPGGSGCTPSASQVAANATLDSDVTTAVNAMADMQAFISSNQLPYLDGIGIDMTVTPAALDVIADDGTVYLGGNFGLTVNDATIVQGNLEGSLGSFMMFENVPVVVSTIQSGDNSTVGTSYGP